MAGGKGGWGPGPRRRPAADRTYALSPGQAVRILIERLARALAPGRPLPARPSSGSAGDQDAPLPTAD